MTKAQLWLDLQAETMSEELSAEGLAQAGLRKPSAARLTAGSARLLEQEWRDVCTVCQIRRKARIWKSASAPLSWPLGCRALLGRSRLIVRCHSPHP